jgi:hypothetical protein
MMLVHKINDEHKEYTHMSLKLLTFGHTFCSEIYQVTYKKKYETVTHRLFLN